MKPAVTTWPVIVLAAVALAGAAAAVASPPASTTEDDTMRVCCVTNPRYSGICRIELGPEETCRDVLDYLNNAASAGKTYCGNTEIRMGWKEVACQEEQASGALSDSRR